MLFCSLSQIDPSDSAKRFLAGTTALLRVASPLAGPPGSSPGQALLFPSASLGGCCAVRFRGVTIAILQNGSLPAQRSCFGSHPASGASRFKPGTGAALPVRKPRPMLFSSRLPNDVSSKNSLPLKLSYRRRPVSKFRHSLMCRRNWPPARACPRMTESGAGATEFRVFQKHANPKLAIRRPFSRHFAPKRPPIGHFADLSRGQ